MNKIKLQASLENNLITKKPHIFLRGIIANYFVNARKAIFITH